MYLNSGEDLASEKCEMPNSRVLGRVCRGRAENVPGRYAAQRWESWRLVYECADFLGPEMVIWVGVLKRYAWHFIMLARRMWMSDGPQEVESTLL
jgi:hypothetical protein